MIIRSIYLGEDPIRRVYRNGIIIKEYENCIAFKGIGESDIFCLASANAFKAGVIGSSVYITSDSEVNMKVIKLIAIKSNSETTTDTVSNAMLFPAEPMVAKAESVSNAKSRCYTIRFVVLGPVEVMIVTDAIARANSNKAALAESRITSNTEVFAETLQFFSPLPFTGEDEYMTYALAKAISVSPLYIGSGKNESVINAAGNLVFSHSAILENGVLEILSAKSANVTNGILEVI